MVGFINYNGLVVFRGESVQPGAGERAGDHAQSLRTPRGKDGCRDERLPDRRRPGDARRHVDHDDPRARHGEDAPLAGDLPPRDLRGLLRVPVRRLTAKKNSQVIFREDLDFFAVLR